MKTAKTHAQVSLRRATWLRLRAIRARLNGTETTITTDDVISAALDAYDEAHGYTHPPDDITAAGIKDHKWEGKGEGNTFLKDD